MHILLTVKESHCGLWCICHEAVVLFDDLTFAHAIKLARHVAGELRVDTGDTVCVELAGSEFAATLAHYTGGVPARQAAFA